MSHGLAFQSKKGLPDFYEFVSHRQLEYKESLTLCKMYVNQINCGLYLTA